MLISKEDYEKLVPVSRDIWDKAFRKFRFSGSGIYFLALSYLVRRYEEIKIIREIEHEGETLYETLPPTAGIGFDPKGGDYYIMMADKVNFFEKQDLTEEQIVDVLADYLIPHELEHFLRLHIPRGSALANRSKVIKKHYGRNAHAVCSRLSNMIEDAQIDNDLRCHSVSDIYFSYDTPKLVKSISGLIPIQKNNMDKLRTMIEDELFTGRGAMLETLFYKIEQMIDVPEVKKQQVKYDKLGIMMSDSPGESGDIGGPGGNDVNLEGYRELSEENNGDDGTNVLGDDKSKPNLSSVIKDDVARQLLKSMRQAGHDTGELGGLIEALDEKRYDIGAFLGMIVAFSVTNTIRFSKRIPARRPNAQAGVTRFTSAPKVAIAADASGSVPMEFYKEFFRIAKSVSEEDGADILFMLFDGDVTYCEQGVPENISKSNGGTNFVPPIKRAVEKGYDKLILLTDMANGDMVPANPNIEIIYIMEERSQLSYLNTAGEKDLNYMYELNVEEKVVIPLR